MIGSGMLGLSAICVGMPARRRCVKSGFRQLLSIGGQAISYALIRVIVAVALPFLRCSPISGAHRLEIGELEPPLVALVQQAEAFDCRLKKLRA